MPASQRPHETSSGGISLTSSLAETLRQLKNRPETTARKKPRATREGIRRDSESGASSGGRGHDASACPPAGPRVKPPVSQGVEGQRDSG